jgi:mRNA interferase RelE/StbE
MEIIYSLEFDERAHRDLKNLDGSIRKQIQEKLEKIRKNPELWPLLKWSLFWLRKIYAVNKKIRIIYQVKNDKLVILVIAVGKRENEEVYKIATKRL